MHTIEERRDQDHARAAGLAFRLSEAELNSTLVLFQDPDRSQIPSRFGRERPTLASLDQLLNRSVDAAEHSVRGSPSVLICVGVARSLPALA
jgi:hypothetical protein